MTWCFVLLAGDNLCTQAGRLIALDKIIVTSDCLGKSYMMLDWEQVQLSGLSFPLDKFHNVVIIVGTVELMVDFILS